MYWSRVQAEMILHLRTRVPNKTLLPLRSVLEYNCQVFHFALPAYLSDAIERVQKRVLAIIYPNIDYADSLDLSGILKLSDRRLNACDKLFNNIFTTPSHNLGHLLPERHIPRYNLKQTRVFVPPRAKTCRFTNTFIPSSAGVYNESWYINYELYFLIDLEI